MLDNPLFFCITMPDSHCLTYKDNASIGNDSRNDFAIGSDNKILGGDRTLSSAKVGDLVLLKADKHYAQINQLETRLETCSLWLDAGGHVWLNNFTYTPLTKTFIITPEIKQFVKSSPTFCKGGFDVNYFFNPRYHYHNYKHNNAGYSIMKELVEFINKSS